MIRHNANYVRYAKFRKVERNLHCDVLYITTVRVARLVLDCNGVFAINAYRAYTSYSSSADVARYSTYPNIPFEQTMHCTNEFLVHLHTLIRDQYRKHLNYSVMLMA